MAWAIALGVLFSAFIGWLVARARFAKASSIDARSDATKLVLSAERRRQREQLVKRVVGEPR